MRVGGNHLTMVLGTTSGGCRGVSSSYPADADAVVLIRRLVSDLAGRADADAERIDAIRLAVSEAATNSVLHGYRDRPGEIHLTAQVIDDELSVSIADDGGGLIDPSESPGLGWGWKLIADACDALTIARRSSGGVEMRMRFQLSAERPPDTEPELTPTGWRIPTAQSCT
jgi:serine/threonine-protein kinase RsbW